MSYLLDKIKSNFQKYGPVTFVKRGFIKITHIVTASLSQLLYSKKYERALDEMINEKEHEIVIIYPFLDFHIPNFQRFQQMAIALSKQANTLVFYVTPNNIYDHVYGFYQYNKQLYLTNQLELLIRKNIANMTIVFSSTDTRFTLEEMKNLQAKQIKIIYDYVDDIDDQITGSSSYDILKRHQEILKDESIKVNATAQLLYEEVAKVRTKNYTLVSNGVNVDDFVIDEKSQEYQKVLSEPKMQKVLALKAKTKILIGYYGALANWFDYDLIKYIAKQKEIGILLIGVDYDQSLAKAQLDEIDNILYIGKIEYDCIKYYANMCDILTIPFKVNDITNKTSPVKLFEYMALQKPIIVTNMYECTQYKSVIVANSQEDFLKKIYTTFNDPKSFDKEMMYQEALANSWTSKASLFLYSSQ